MVGKVNPILYSDPTDLAYSESGPIGGLPLKDLVNNYKWNVQNNTMQLVFQNIPWVKDFGKYSVMSLPNEMGSIIIESQFITYSPEVGIAMYLAPEGASDTVVQKDNSRTQSYTFAVSLVLDGETLEDFNTNVGLFTFSIENSVEANAHYRDDNDIFGYDTTTLNQELIDMIDVTNLVWGAQTHPDGSLSFDTTSQYSYQITDTITRIQVGYVFFFGDDNVITDNTDGTLTITFPPNMVSRTFDQGNETAFILLPAYDYEDPDSDEFPSLSDSEQGTPEGQALFVRDPSSIKALFYKVPEELRS